MNCANDLDKVVRAALRQLLAIEAQLTKTGLDPKATERNIALCLIDAQSIWSLFTRSFFVSCFIGASRAGGGRVTTTALAPHTPADAIRWASVTMDPRLASRSRIGPLDEPRWHLALTLPRLAQRAGFSNEAQILAAFAVPGPVFADLPKARNFYAHRSHRTANTLKTLVTSYRLPANIRAGEIPGRQHPTRAGTIAQSWLAQIVSTVRLLPN